MIAAASYSLFLSDRASANVRAEGCLHANIRG